MRIISQDINPPTLLSQVDKVYCVTSQMGFEALLSKVVTFECALVCRLKQPMIVIHLLLN
ncbi:hypothetical protein INT80_15050 [Gallibacterium anatis]|uniref:Uncharacterized protein n=1 Tax=Gallibacterium anatis TaxID=750 RepID=A0A930UVV0_9PAST|nr:hypothetical protein [Gallibacterium anatis]